jgi:hypothetical protein
MPPLHVSGDALLELRESPGLRFRDEQRVVDVFGGVLRHSANDHDVALLVPLQDGAGTDPQFAPDFRRH